MSVTDSNYDPVADSIGSFEDACAAIRESIDALKKATADLQAQCEKKYGVSIIGVQSAVADKFGVTLAQLRSTDRVQSVVRSRWVAMLLSRELTGKSYLVIGRMFGGRDHSSVIQAIRSVERICAKEPEFAATVEELRRRITNG